ncbi:MAG: GGDEF domain-containing protein, partial [Spirochaetota bacterium]
HPDDDNPVSIILQKNTAVVVQDMMQEYPDYPVLKLTEVPIRSWIGVPLHLNEKTVGVLTFGHERKGLFRGRDLTLLQALADHVAIALENARLHEKIYRLAMVDPLMGIGSRHNFNHQGHLLFAQAKRYRRELSLLIIDVDHFKKINDTYGHDTGDIVLKKIAAACSGVLRDSDMIARYGGEEIVVLLPETGLTQGILVAERIRESITMMDVDLIEWTVTASIGIYAGIPDPDGTLDQYLQNADEALYQAKECGRNCVRYIR